MLGCFHDITTSLKKRKKNSFHFFKDFRRQSIRSTGSFTLPIDVYRAYCEASSGFYREKVKPKTRFLTCWASGKKTCAPPAGSASKGTNVNNWGHTKDFTWSNPGSSRAYGPWRHRKRVLVTLNVPPSWTGRRKQNGVDAHPLPGPVAISSGCRFSRVLACWDNELWLPSELGPRWRGPRWRVPQLRRGLRRKLWRGPRRESRLRRWRRRRRRGWSRRPRPTSRAPERPRNRLVVREETRPEEQGSGEAGGNLRLGSGGGWNRTGFLFHPSTPNFFFPFRFFNWCMCFVKCKCWSFQ